MYKYLQRDKCMSLYQKLTNLPTEDLLLLINQCKSKREIMRKIGFNGTDARASKYLFNFIELNNVDISHFILGGQRKKSTYNIDDLKNAIKKSICITEVLRNLKLSEVGGNAQTIKNLIKKHDISTDHFDIGKARQRNHPVYTKEEIFIENSVVSRTVLRSHTIKNKIIPYICECGNAGEWKGEQLTLDLDHTNGNRVDNRPENLRFLCPNCHSQTTTFRGKNNKRSLE